MIDTSPGIERGRSGERSSRSCQAQFRGVRKNKGHVLSFTFLVFCLWCFVL